MIMMMMVIIIIIIIIMIIIVIIIIISSSSSNMITIIISMIMIMIIRGARTRPSEGPTGWGDPRPPPPEAPMPSRYVMTLCSMRHRGSHQPSIRKLKRQILGLAGVWCGSDIHFDSVVDLAKCGIIMH